MPVKEHSERGAARVAGAPWQQVATVVGYSSAAVACRAVTRYFGRPAELDQDQQRTLWRDRMEVLWRQSTRDVSEQRPGAIRAGVAVAQRAGLDGLDAPTRIDLRDPVAAEFDRTLRFLVEQARAGQPQEADISEGEYEDADPSEAGQVRAALDRR